MKRWRIFLVVALFLVVLGSTVAVYADTGGPPDPEDLPGLGDPPQQGPGHHPRPPRGLRGEVTAVSDTGLTLLVRNQLSVEVNVDDQTKVWLVETQTQGSLTDIEVGNRVLVQGHRAGGSPPAIDARRIVVSPAGDEVHGRVTAVEGSLITLATPQQDDPASEVAVITDGNTAFRLGRSEGSLDDVTEGKFVVAFGEIQPDDSLLARLVIIDNRPPPVRNLRGEVTAVSATGLTLLTRNDVSVQVNVDDNTKVWLAETQTQGSLADVEVGDQVLARGTRTQASASAENDAPAMDARHIVVAPDGDEVHGRVTAVDGAVITIVFPQPDSQEGEATIVTNDDTTFRIHTAHWGWREGSLDDVTEGRFVVAFGEIQPDDSLLARLVFMRSRPNNRPPRSHPGPGPVQDRDGAGGAPLSDLRVRLQPGDLPEDVWAGVL